jgi:hypothetical protein
MASVSFSSLAASAFTYLLKASCVAVNAFSTTASFSTFSASTFSTSDDSSDKSFS